MILASEPERLLLIALVLALHDMVLGLQKKHWDTGASIRSSSRSRSPVGCVSRSWAKRLADGHGPRDSL
jgi:hypothetical protein